LKQRKMRKNVRHAWQVSQMPQMPQMPQVPQVRHALHGAPSAAMLAALMLATLTGCRAPPPQATPPVHPPAQADTRPPVDASYDWHGLLVAPFGSVLKDIPLALHEVLLFRDDAHGSAAVDDAECYAADTPAPRFLGRTPDEYLLCFKQDRLARIQASVRMAAAEAPEVFATACAGWLKNHAAVGATAVELTTAGATAAGTTAAGTTAAGATTAEPAAAGSPAQAGGACKGRDGAIRFSARTEEESDSAEATLSITLDSAPDP